MAQTKGYEMNSPPQQSSQFQAPQQQQHTTVIINQPSAPTNPLLVGTVQGTREWSSGLLDCSEDIGSMAFTCCCYPCSVCTIGNRIGENWFTLCFVPAADITYRTRIRTLGGIRGDMFSDCMSVTCCPACAVCQEQRELTTMGL
ncbi:uncharacterized protein LOC143048644 [Mytilus galloprovincialis]|uniref:Uncharacterized protein n=1 Tax=Mytilus galloprovincialis TaxID=29158 RepID=A0A8B6FFN9_MYTGA|nr:Hypothetical predicted protein [Mytilus galloprovincialis]